MPDNVDDIVLDFSSVVADEYTIPPRGQHPVKVEDVYVRIGKDSKMPYLRFRCRITDGEGEGKYVYTNVSLGSRDPEKHIKMQGRNKAFFASFGFRDENLHLKADRHGEDPARGQLLLEPDFTDLPGEVVVRHKKDDDGVTAYDVTRFSGTVKPEPVASGDAPPARRVFKG